MSSNTDTTTVRSICIPRVFDNIGEARIRVVFEKLDIFEIERVDIIQKQNERGENSSGFSFTSRAGPMSQMR